MPWNWTVSVVIAAATSVLVFGQSAIAQIEQPADPFALVLIHADLDDADKVMQVRDINKDGLLDEKERAHMNWDKTVLTYDLNHDGKLSHMEIAILSAARRGDNDVQQIDRTVVQRAMNLRDKNRNGQIDPDEITSDWPDEPDEIDVNHDKILTIEELTNAFAFRRVVREETGITGLDQGWAIKIRNRFDLNRDGGLNPGEWDKTPLPGNPADFDRDNDKRLSILEMATMIAKHRQKLGLTAKDIREARTLMLRFDEDFNGVIDKQEMQALVAALGDQVEQFKALDADKNGEISLLEIETAYSKRRDELGYSDQDARNAINYIQRHDENRDHRISKEELKDEPSSGYLAKQDLPQIDRNSDGYIDRDELARYLAREKSQTDLPK